MNVSVIEKLGLGALLCAWLVAGASWLGNMLVPVDDTIVADVGEEAPAAVAEGEPEPEVDFASLLAVADPAEGEKVFSKCKSCHTIEEGGDHKIGPNLHNVVGRPIAAKEGFDYSSALADAGSVWDYPALEKFLEDPRGYLTGTKMSFAGLRKPQDRAEVIAYMREYTEDPPPLPEVPVAAEPEVVEEAMAAEEPPEGARTRPLVDAEQKAVEGGGEPEGKAVVDAEPTAVEGADEPEAEAAGEDAAGGTQMASLFAATDASAGEKVFRKCQACHSIDEGGRHKIGPNLWDIVGEPVAHKDGFNYSSALTDLGGEWTYDRLSEYLADPRGYAPGTKMSFAGLKKPEDRAAVILYLRDHAESPPPLP